MAVEEQTTVSLSAAGRDDTLGQLHFTHYDRSDRMKRALIGLLGSWLLAALSIPIVLAHWLLVPAFTIAGPILFYKRLHQDVSLRKVDGPCPICREAFSLALEATDKLPKWDYCPHCNGSVQIGERL